jgi:hypothetical protein
MLQIVWATIVVGELFLGRAGGSTAAVVIVTGIIIIINSFARP